METSNYSDEFKRDAVSLKDRSTGEPAFLIEVVEDRGMNGCELDHLPATRASIECYLFNP